MLEVKDALEEEEEEEEELLLSVVDEDVALVALDAAAFEDVLEEDELAAGLEELVGAGVVCGVVVCACDADVGVGLEVAGAGALC
jgi:hypothetical protein